MKRLLSALSLAVLLAVPAHADDPAIMACEKAFNACMSDCAGKHPDSEAKVAACGTVCAAERAACEAAAGYEKARPWLDEQLRKARDWLEWLERELDTVKPAPAPKPAPEPDTAKDI